MRQRLFLLALSAMAVLGIHAAPNSLMLVMKTGEQYDFLMADRPRIAVKEGQFIITTQQIVISVSDNDVSYFCLGDSADGIERLTPSPSFTVEGGKVCLTNIPVGQLVLVYDAVGRLTWKQRTGWDGRFTFQAPAGMYVVKYGNHSFKVKL